VWQFLLNASLAFCCVLVLRFDLIFRRKPFVAALCFSCILLCFSFTSCIDISSKAFRIKPTVSKILMIDVTTNTLQAEISWSPYVPEGEYVTGYRLIDARQMLKFLFLQFVVVLRNQAPPNNFDLCLSDVQL